MPTIDSIEVADERLKPTPTAEEQRVLDAQASNASN
jgi:hypothetical protein